MRKIISIIIIVILFSLGFVIAHGEEDFAIAEQIIKDKILCSNLSEDQLEILGDYYMEQMHPGEVHEIMDEGMGGEGSENLRLIHISMGKAFYCGEHQAMGSEMMGKMMGRGMMSGFYGGFGGMWLFGWIFMTLIIVILVLFIAWLIKQIKKPKRR